MKRVDITYGGVQYSLPRTTVDEVKASLHEALTSEAGFGWMTVNFGEGKPQSVEILIAPHIDIALSQVSTEDDERPSVHSEAFGGIDNTRAFGAEAAEGDHDGAALAAHDPEI